MMAEIFRADIYKLRKSRSVRVCLIVSFFLGVLMSIMYYVAWQEMTKTIEETQKMIEGMGDYSGIVMEAMDILPSDDLWSYINVSLCDLNVLYIAAVAIGIFVGSEYSMGTMRNPLTRGFSRNSVFFSKLISSVIVMVLTAFVYAVGSAVPGMILFGFSAKLSAGNILLCLALYLLLFIAAASFYTMLAVVTKRTGYAIALAIIIPIVVTAIVNVIKIGNHDFGNISRFWLFETITNTQKLVKNGEAFVPAISGAVYLTLSTVIGYGVFRKQSIS